jgi:hypothetical protein
VYAGLDRDPGALERIDGMPQEGLSGTLQLVLQRGWRDYLVVHYEEGDMMGDGRGALS